MMTAALVLPINIRLPGVANDGFGVAAQILKIPAGCPSVVLPSPNSARMPPSCPTSELAAHLPPQGPGPSGSLNGPNGPLPGDPSPSKTVMVRLATYLVQ